MPLELSARVAASEVHVSSAGSPSPTTLSLAELDLRASLGLFDRWFVETLVPIRFVRLADAAPASDDRVGIADPELALRVRILGEPSPEVGTLRLDLRFGATLPFGRVDTTPYTNAGGVIRESYFFGRGTIDPVLGLQASLPFSKIGLFGFAWGRASLYDDAYGFRGGARGASGIGADFGRDSWRIAMIGGAYHEAADRWSNGLRPEYSGHTDIFAELTVRVLRDTAWPLAVSVLIPATIRANAAAYHSPATIAITAEHAFQL